MDGTLYYVHQDHLGSTVAVSDAAGGEVGRVQYDPYGEVITGTLPVTLTDRLFTGARFDGTIGLYQMGARRYDPALGRWIQADTIVPEPLSPQDLNRYTYVWNNPLRYTDPSGHQPEGWNWWHVVVTAFTFDIFAYTDLAGGLPRGTTARRMQAQLEEIQAWQRRNIREPMYARVPVLKTIDEIVESPEFQMGLMAAMMTVNAPPEGTLRGKGAISNRGITNPIPRRLARVVPARYAESPTLGAPGAQEVFVTAAEDIAGITTSRGLAERLTLVDEAGNLIEGPFAVFEFDAPVSGVASPVFRSSPGFVGGGLTAGGAREFVIPNLLLSDLENLIIRIIH